MLKWSKKTLLGNGDSTGNGLSLLGSYQGLTYYSQADSRWANVMYSSVGDSSQTMKSSACGPTSAAMVVSSSKGTILPTIMASLAVSNGYRTASSGTAWSYYSFVADYFDFDEFYSTSSYTTALKYLNTDDDNDGVSDYFIIVSCGSGLFTTGGHYIVLVADNNDTITVYDPYLYDGKFSTASRKSAGVVVSGNSVYVTESSFKTYANAKNYWIFSNDEGSGNPNATSTSTSSSSSSSETSVNYTRYVSTSSANLNVRSSASTSSTVLTTLKKGTAVTVSKVSGSWSYITSPTIGWVSSAYLSSTKVSTSSSSSSTSSTSYSTTIGKSYTLKSKTTLYSKGSLSGTTYSYLKGTKIKVISHYSNNVDYIYVSKTGRYAYCKTSAYSSGTTTSTTSTTNYTTTVGSYYTLKSKTTLYSKGSLSGTTYSYLKGTKIKVISHYSSTVDYIYVPKTRTICLL